MIDIQNALRAIKLCKCKTKTNSGSGNSPKSASSSLPSPKVDIVVRSKRQCSCTPTYPRTHRCSQNSLLEATGWLQWLRVPSLGPQTEELVEMGTLVISSLSTLFAPASDEHSSVCGKPRPHREGSRDWRN